ncbi:bifunctional DNA primase/polymerase [Streptomyces sp. YIM 98790]|uniref:bifunctional DNA primase/polymerase n=1 Tax=Streptomyces sp. YIM 98790 TaxID=2689077 RepID=UPI001409ACD4|nr:bifunctional DNA primase/polymerase [Streptomyces sp. YIM 98790]
MSHHRRSLLLAAALAAAARGWPVIPLRPGGKRPAGHPEDRCPRAGRCAAGHRTPEQRATTDRTLIEACWAQRPYNVGIATGPAGLVVVDLDVPKGPGDRPRDEWTLPGVSDGMDVFAVLCERHGEQFPADTYTVRTRRGGVHLYFAAPAGAELRNTSGQLGWKVDTRAHGGYVVAAGSQVDGRPYTVLNDAPPAMLPGWLMTALTPPRRSVARPVITAPRNAGRVARVALERESQAIASAPEGERERRLFTASRAMGRFVAWGDIARHEVEEAFQAAGQAAGLKPHECRSTLRSALNWSIRTARPREAV